MKKYLFILLLLPIWLGCEKDANVFDVSPAERKHQGIQTLRNELTQAPYGWKMTYFTRTDSLLFTDIKKVYKRSTLRFQKQIKEKGFGGFQFFLEFDTVGTVLMRMDSNSTSCTTLQKSEFEIRQNSTPQLSFTTYNYIHDIVNEDFRAMSDFLYIGKDTIGNLLFRTSNFIEPAREYILFEKIKTKSDKTNFLQASLENRLFFENMQNPQLIIRRGSRIYFKSNVYLKRNVHGINTKFLNTIKSNRYFVFEEDIDPTVILEDRRRSHFLGSGYVGTEYGIMFRAGIRFRKNIIFYNFQRKENKFESIHRDQYGIETKYVAEIWDDVENVY